MNKQKIIVVIIAMAITATFFTIDSQKAYAQDKKGASQPNYFQDLSQYISQKFSLDKTTVEKAVNEYRDTKKLSSSPRPTKTEEQIVAEQKSRLDQFVKNGKITQEQQTLILNELSLLRSKYNFDMLKNLSIEERKAKMTEMRDEILSWAEANNIDSYYLNPSFRNSKNIKYRQ